jgi:4-hydroxy-tetrahydrodipicolinate synthase
MRYHGVFTAMVTPFKGESLDEAALEAFVEWQIAEGVHGLVPCGTTGESPTLSHEEHKRVIQLTVRTAATRVPVMAGTGSNSTAEAIDLSRAAEKAGASALLVVAPYYNKPTQEGIYQHFKAVAESTALPVFVYNIPGRSVINISDVTLARLAEIPTIAGVKDATGDLARVSTLRALVGDRLTLLSGEDMTAVGFNAMGGKGCISVTSNIAPRACANVQNLTLAGDYAAARAAHEKLTLLHNAMFCETNPVPVKYAVSLLGKCDASVRLPLVDATPEAQKTVSQAMCAAGLL